MRKNRHKAGTPQLIRLAVWAFDEQFHPFRCVRSEKDHQRWGGTALDIAYTASTRQNGQKNLVSGSTMLTGKFLQIPKVLAGWPAGCPEYLGMIWIILTNPESE